MGVGVRALLIIVAAALPSLLAPMKHHSHRTGIFLANVAGIFTLWLVVAFAWCFVDLVKCSSLLGQVLSARAAPLTESHARVPGT